LANEWKKAFRDGGRKRINAGAGGSELKLPGLMRGPIFIPDRKHKLQL
jgi:hypothetical protein